MGKGDKGAKIFKTKRGRGAVIARTEDILRAVERNERSDRETIRASYAGAASATRSRPAARTSRARTCTASSAARPARRRASPSAAPWRGAA